MNSAPASGNHIMAGIPAIDRLSKHCFESASYLIGQNISRGTRTFTISIEKLDDSEVDISKADFLKLRLLPTGSRWEQSLGWHSYFGVPFRHRGVDWISIGVETVVRHEKGDTYPIFQAFVYQLSDVAFLRCLRNFVHEISKRKYELQKIPKGVIISNSRTPSEHTNIEAFIIQSAIVFYERKYSNCGARKKNWLKKMLSRFQSQENQIQKTTYPIIENSLIFRTLILSDSQLKSLSTTYPSPNYFGKKSGYLLSTVPDIQKTFSRSTNIKLRMCKSRL